jgi:hypothetical protein
LTDKAHDIYQKIKSHERSKFVSDAIIEKYEGSPNIMNERIEALERKLSEILNRME